MVFQVTIDHRTYVIHTQTCYKVTAKVEEKRKCKLTYPIDDIFLHMKKKEILKKEKEKNFLLFILFYLCIFCCKIFSLFVNFMLFLSRNPNIISKIAFYFF